MQWRHGNVSKPRILWAKWRYFRRLDKMRNNEGNQVKIVRTQLPNKIFLTSPMNSLSKNENIIPILCEQSKNFTPSFPKWDRIYRILHKSRCMILSSLNWHLLIIHENLCKMWFFITFSMHLWKISQHRYLWNVLN